MAGNKVSTKAKGKEDKNKGTKGVTQNNEDSEDVIDFTVLRKPVPTSITGFAQARKIFDLATEELKDLLSNECDLLYECKVCRNIFRSLANFISHKRVYCKEKFNSSSHGHFVHTNSMIQELQQIRTLEEDYKEFLKTKNSERPKDTEEKDEQIPLTKDLTAVYEKITQTKGTVESNEDPTMVFKNIPSSSIAVFQTVSFEDNKADNMRTEVQELDVILSRDRAVLQSDGKFVIESSKTPNRLTENVIHISDDEDNDNTTGDTLKCKICDLQFSTQKTLKFHIKYKHLESRLVYPCPDCLEIFSTSWSVYRHLFKVHRKTAAQVRRLRESIQAKAFRMNNPPAFYSKRRNMKPSAPAPAPLTEDQENQAWLDNVESLGSVPRCGGCGRSFERRAALAAHTAACMPRARALRPPPPPASDPRRIQIQIRKDYNKDPPAKDYSKEPSGLTILKPAQLQNKVVAEETTQTPPEKNETDKEIVEKENEPKDANDEPMDLDEEDRSDGSAESPEKVYINPQDDIKPNIRLPFALQAEKSNVAAFKQRIAADTDFTKLICKKCDTKVKTVIDLYDHMADHVKWLRYACKLCNFKHYKFEKLPEHVRLVHKLKGDSDFYYSTVKAIDGKEAMMMSTCLAEAEEKEEESNNGNEGSPESRRPSRCSSDSSRVSDDSSSSSNLKEITRKRKIYHGRGMAKKKKEMNDDGEDQKDGEINENASNIRSFEENSSDIDELEEKISKRHSIDDMTSMHSRRPVRKRTKVKNADFEYDLSNLLKMEAQGYRDSSVPTPRPQAPTTTTSTKVTPTPNPTANKVKKKVFHELSVNDFHNKYFAGALFTLSKKAVENSSAHMRTSKVAVYTAEQRSNVFARPLLPRILSRGDKASPKKDVTEDIKDPSQGKVFKATETPKNVEGNDIEMKSKDDSENLPKEDFKIVLKSKPINSSREQSANNTGSSILDDAIPKNTEKEDIDENKTDADKIQNIPAVVPIQFRRQSIELMKNPIINKNIAELSKAGMKTKILVIKPINKKGDGRPFNAPLKFQTIKLKDPSKVSSSEDKASDQVMVVKVPKVPCSNVSDKVVTLPGEAADNVNAKNDTESHQSIELTNTEENHVSDDVQSNENKNKTVNNETKDETVNTNENKHETVVPEQEAAETSDVIENGTVAEESKSIEMIAT